jgi:hypothetical protein
MNKFSRRPEALEHSRVFYEAKTRQFGKLKSTEPIAKSAAERLSQKDNRKLQKYF